MSVVTTLISYEHANLLATITDERMCICEEILDAVNSDSDNMFFVYGFGGTEKAYLWNLLGASVRSGNDIVLNVALSGIVDLL